MAAKPAAPTVSELPSLGATPTTRASLVDERPQEFNIMLPPMIKQGARLRVTVPGTSERIVVALPMDAMPGSRVYFVLPVTTGRRSADGSSSEVLIDLFGSNALRRRTSS